MPQTSKAFIAGFLRTLWVLGFRPRVDSMALRLVIARSRL